MKDIQEVGFEEAKKILRVRPKTRWCDCCEYGEDEGACEAANCFGGIMLDMSVQAKFKRMIEAGERFLAMVEQLTEENKKASDDELLEAFSDESGKQLQERGNKLSNRISERF